MYLAPYRCAPFKGEKENLLGRRKEGINDSLKRYKECGHRPQLSRKEEGKSVEDHIKEGYGPVGLLYGHPVEDEGGEDDLDKKGQGIDGDIEPRQVLGLGDLALNQGIKEDIELEVGQIDTKLCHDNQEGQEKNIFLDRIQGLEGVVHF